MNYFPFESDLRPKKAKNDENELLTRVQDLQCIAALSAQISCEFAFCGVPFCTHLNNKRNANVLFLLIGFVGQVHAGHTTRTSLIMS